MNKTGQLLILIFLFLMLQSTTATKKVLSQSTSLLTKVASAMYRPFVISNAAVTATVQLQLKLTGVTMGSVPMMVSTFPSAPQLSIPLYIFMT